MIDTKNNMPPQESQSELESDRKHNISLQRFRSHASEDDLEEADIEEAELAPLTESKNGAGDELEPKDAQDDMTTLEWMSFHFKKNGKVLGACGSYSFCSISMVLVNKSLASSYSHLIDGDLNISLVVFQAIVAVAAVEVCKRLKWIDIPSFSLDIAKQWAPVNIFFCAMLFTGMASLQYNSVPMVTIFKNISNITTAIGEYYFLGNRAENLVIAAFGIMLLGAVAAAGNDMSISGIGMAWILANCVSCSGYVLYMKHATETIKLQKFGMVYYNNLLCVFFLLPVAIFMGETKLFLDSKVLHSAEYATKNLFAGLVGFFLNFASLSAVAAAGPTTYVAIGAMNKIPVAFLGYWLFDSEMTKETFFFIAVSMCGGFLFSYAKLQSSSTKRTTRTK